VFGSVSNLLYQNYDNCHVLYLSDFPGRIQICWDFPLRKTPFLKMHLAARCVFFLKCLEAAIWSVGVALRLTTPPICNVKVETDCLDHPQHQPCASLALRALLSHSFLCSIAAFQSTSHIPGRQSMKTRCWMILTTWPSTRSGVLHWHKRFKFQCGLCVTDWVVLWLSINLFFVLHQIAACYIVVLWVLTINNILVRNESVSQSVCKFTEHT